MSLKFPAGNPISIGSRDTFGRWLLASRDLSSGKPDGRCALVSPAMTTIAATGAICVPAA
jgi:hypothetical protein